MMAWEFFGKYATRWHNISMSRVFKTRYFSRWMRKTALTDPALCAAVEEMRCGLVDADLGGGVVKKRVALPGRGKSGGARTLVATRLGNRWFFVFGFEKSARANISAVELEALQALASQLLARTPAQLNKAVEDGFLQEICHERQDPHQASRQESDP
ncbi:type II toxin-antitoxin system RelE/ParE family toxin [Vandammella animalimorsus]